MFKYEIFDATTSLTTHDFKCLHLLTLKCKDSRLWFQNVSNRQFKAFHMQEDMWRCISGLSQRFWKMWSRVYHGLLGCALGGNYVHTTILLIKGPALPAKYLFDFESGFDGHARCVADLPTPKTQIRPATRRNKCQFRLDTMIKLNM